MKEFAGIIAVVLSLIGYVPYLRDVFRGKTKPHAFSWIVWTVITFIVGFAQLAAGAGRGTIHNLVTGVICLVIVFYALRNKDKDIKRVDVYLFSAALAAIPLWVITKSPTYSIIMITVIDIFAFIPTIRKTWNDPASETLVSYILAGIKYCVALIALSTYSASTLVYPIALIAMNVATVGVIVLRHGTLRSAKRRLTSLTQDQPID